MVYMSVVSRTEKTLHLARIPGLRAWSTFVGILAVGLGMVIFSNDDWLWKCFCLFCCGFVAICSLDDWEECIIEKGGEIRLKRFSLIEKLLRPSESQREIVAETDSVMKAEVQAEKIRFFGTGRVVMLTFSAGYTMPLTEKCTLGDGMDHQYVADIIHAYLDLGQKTWMGMEYKAPDTQPPPSSSSSSDEEEEHFET